jgi:hypothetical protein
MFDTATNANSRKLFLMVFEVAVESLLVIGSEGSGCGDVGPCGSGALPSLPLRQRGQEFERLRLRELCAGIAGIHGAAGK